ncbi:MAG TPA: tRNA pseudouridine(38-40) synthase TruA [Candidatus Cloacimonadota bacterium]|nr:tRNA pseudouridine(38-40) synthase TruA [Candidatus Cloacimonadota bacterium]
MRYLAKVAYDGTNFCGWQIQNGQRTIQGVIEKALFLIAKTEIPVTGAGRTDAGVHALGQYFHFDFPLGMTADQIKKALQTKLPYEIKIVAILSVREDFHARYQAIRRRYQFIISQNPSPFNRDFAASFPGIKFDLDLMRSIADMFLGSHDFTSFSKFNPEIVSQICHIQEFVISEHQDEIILQISADRFLHNMVRRITGCLINIMRKKENPEIVKSLLAAKSTQNKLISTAPAKGLYLLDVVYPPAFFL